MTTFIQPKCSKAILDECIRECTPLTTPSHHAPRAMDILSHLEGNFPESDLVNSYLFLLDHHYLELLPAPGAPVPPRHANLRQQRIWRVTSNGLKFYSALCQPAILKKLVNLKLFQKLAALIEAGSDLADLIRFFL